MSGPSAAMIQNSTSVDVKGGEFITSAKDTNVHKSYYNVNIVFSDVTGFFHFATKHVIEWIGSRDRDPVEISDLVPPDPSSLPPVSSIADRYTRSMLECMVGYPLYNPKPFSELSMEYPRNGVNIGDVGFVRTDGDFDFLFNICLPQRSFINPFNLPDDYLLATPDHSTTKVLESLPHNKCLIPRTVKITKSGEYICEGSEGAILELPKGAIRNEVINIKPFEDLAKLRGVQWYEYAIARGRNISNGSLYLVTSFSKCTQWGIAVFDRPCGPEEGLTFVSSPFGWKGSRVFTTKVAEPNQGDATPNQCAFLRGYKIKLRQDIFDNLYNNQLRGSDSASTIPFSSPQAGTSRLTRQPAQRIRGGGGTDIFSRILAVGKPSTSTKLTVKTDEVVLHPDFNSSPFHPLDVLNTALLSQNPDAKVAITHDDVWCDLMRDNFPTLNYATLIGIAQSYTSMIDKYGCVSLEKISDSSNVVNERSHSDLGTETAVIEDRGKPSRSFPPSWDPSRTCIRDHTTLVLQQNDRTTADEQSKNPLMPLTIEDEYSKGALKLVAKPDSPHLQTALSSLFNQPLDPSQGFSYDHEADAPLALLNNMVIERLSAFFRLHGAIDVEPPLLMPITDLEGPNNHATFIDRHGGIVMLPDNILVPFARLAARDNTKRIKRFHIADVYRPNQLAGHPKMFKAAAFDIITQDLKWGPIAAGAEIISIADECLTSFPDLAMNYEICISHAQIIKLALSRIPAGQHDGVVDILTQAKSTVSQKYELLLKKGLPRNTADEFQVLSDSNNEINGLLSRLEKISPTFVTLIQPYMDEIKRTIQYAAAAGVTKPIYFHPLMLNGYLKYFKDGVIIEVVRKNKPAEVLATGGRYESLITRYFPPKAKVNSICAFGIQIAVDKITSAIVTYQSASLKTLLKEGRSFGFWSPRRCDVYVISYHPGYLQERMEVVKDLWKHYISADIMYESDVSGNENNVEMCVREGILFTVYPRPRTAGRGEQAAFKVKSILRGTEYELSKQDLVGWLQQQISEQKRIDLSTSGVPGLSEGTLSNITIKSTKESATASSDLQLVLPPDTKKQRKQVKQLFMDRAYKTSMQLKQSIQNGLPTLAVDVPPTVFEVMVRNSSWITEEEAWKSMLSLFTLQNGKVYAQQIREAAAKKRAEGHRFLILYAVKEETVQLLNFQ